MSKRNIWIVVGTLIGGALLGPGSVHGQDFDSAAILYGDGVRAYFSGDSHKAEASLSGALELNSQDPRIYYFRALSLLRQGRTAEARGDMMVGAALEAQRPNRFAIGTALERVQGGNRLLLEQFRRQARLDAAANGPPASQPKIGRAADMLRERVVISLDEYLQPGEPKPAPAGVIETPPPRTFAPPAANQAAPAKSPDDPFRDDPQPPATAAPVMPPAPAPEAAPPPGETDSIEEVPATDEEDPFGPI